MRSERCKRKLLPLLLFVLGVSVAPFGATAQTCTERISDAVFDVVHRKTDALIGKAFLVDAQKGLLFTASHLAAHLDSPIDPAPDGDINVRLKFQDQTFTFDIVAIGDGNQLQNFMADWALLRIKPLPGQTELDSAALSALMSAFPLPLRYGLLEASAMTQGQVAVGPGGAMTLSSVKVTAPAHRFSCRPDAPTLLSMSGYVKGHSGAAVVWHPSGKECQVYAVTSRFAPLNTGATDEMKQRYIKAIQEFLNVKDMVLAAKTMDVTRPLEERFQMAAVAMEQSAPVNVVPLRCVVDDLIRSSWSNDHAVPRELIRQQRSEVSKRLIAMFASKNGLSDDDYHRRLANEARKVREQYWSGGVTWLDLLQVTDSIFSTGTEPMTEKDHSERYFLQFMLNELGYDSVIRLFRRLAAKTDDAKATLAPTSTSRERPAVQFVRANAERTVSETAPMLGLAFGFDVPSYDGAPERRVAFANKLLRLQSGDSVQVGDAGSVDASTAATLRDLATSLISSALRDNPFGTNANERAFYASAATGLSQVALSDGLSASWVRAFHGRQPLEQELAYIALKELPEAEKLLRLEATRSVMSSENRKSFGASAFPGGDVGSAIWDKQERDLKGEKPSIWMQDNWRYNFLKQ